MLFKLKARIIEMYGKQSRFAVCCGKNEQWLSRILTGRQLVTKEEKEFLRRKLKIGNIDEYFKETTLSE